MGGAQNGLGPASTLTVTVFVISPDTHSKHRIDPNFSVEPLKVGLFARHHTYSVNHRECSGQTNIAHYWHTSFGSGFFLVEVTRVFAELNEDCSTKPFDNWVFQF